MLDTLRDYSVKILVGLCRVAARDIGGAPLAPGKWDDRCAVWQEGVAEGQAFRFHPTKTKKKNAAGGEGGGVWPLFGRRLIVHPI